MALFLVREFPQELPDGAFCCRSLKECSAEQLNDPDIAVYLLQEEKAAAGSELALRAEGFLQADKACGFQTFGSGMAKEAVLSYCSIEMEESSSIDDYESEDRNFADMCRWWMENKKINIRDFYRRANITRGAFYHITHSQGYIPKRATAFACIIGLELDYDQAVDLLSRAGLAFSSYFPLDVIVEGFIKQGYYDIRRINEVLFDKDLQLLGSA